jgi:hypothetical protein
VKGKAAAKGKGREKSQPLFLESGDEDDDEIEDFADEINAIGSSDEDEDESTMRSTRKKTVKTTSRAKAREPPASSTSANRTKRPVAEVLDDDADDGLTFGGFGGRKRTRRK